jgi:hypothetical protein
VSAVLVPPIEERLSPFWGEIKEIALTPNAFDKSFANLSDNRDRIVGMG